MSVEIHPLASVAPEAQLGTNITIGPFAVIEPDVKIGDGSTIYSHATLLNGSRIGQDCSIFPGAVIGAVPQDLKFKGEQTFAIIGDRTVIRECATVNRGTDATGRAIIGKDCLIMAYCHVAHDCSVGDHVVMSNVSQLAGHVTIGNWVILGGLAKIIQFCSVGDHAMIGADCKVTKDVAPYALIGREPAKVEGVNKIGLRRRGFSNQAIDAIQELYSAVFFSGMNTSDGMEEYERLHEHVLPEVEKCISFIRSSQKGIIR
ncbi:MAG: acyl-ACP--UDP-N-acetylglucosamine O-acyltransferase [Ignavibacteria bacterium]|jgi:UDP-N-acetylglucosamine acyltransferase